MRGLDSVTAGDIPVQGTDVVFGYTDPFKWSDADFARFPNIPHILTSLRTAFDGDELDVETGAVDPNDAAGICDWVRRNPRRMVSIYVNGSTQPKVRGFIDSAGLTEKVVYRFAIWNGPPSTRPDRAWAEQYSAPGFGAPGHYDENMIWDMSWLDPNFVPPPAPPVLARVLKMGDTGEDVRGLQLSLNAAGAALVVDGDFGPATQQAVMFYQTRHGLTVDGEAGPETLGSLANNTPEVQPGPQPPQVPTGTDRGALVGAALSQLGYLRGQGYDQVNKYSSDLGLPGEAWCADFVTWIFMQKGVSLPSMQVGHPQGYSYVPSAVQYGRDHGITRNSWDAEPGDIFCFDWNGDGVADHTEIMVSKDGSTVNTVGGNSGPGGGVNEHGWNCPAGVGNNQVLTVLNAAALVNLGGTPTVGPAPIPAPAPPPPGPSGPPWSGRVLVLKSPHMTGNDVRQVQQRLIDRGWTVPGGVDGDYGPGTASIIGQFQQDKGLGVDQQCGPITWAELMRTDNVTP